MKKDPGKFVIIVTISVCVKGCSRPSQSASIPPCLWLPLSQCSSFFIPPTISPLFLQVFSGREFYMYCCFPSGLHPNAIMQSLNLSTRRCIRHVAWRRLSNTIPLCLFITSLILLLCCVAYSRFFLLQAIEYLKSFSNIQTRMFEKVISVTC